MALVTKVTKLRATKRPDPQRDEFARVLEAEASRKREIMVC
jgi:hypothetical protein